MNNLKQLTTCVSLGLLVAGCDDTAKIGDNPQQRAEVPALAKPDRKSGIMAQVKKDVGEILGIGSDRIKESDQFIRDLGADSLDTVEIVMATEEAFDIAIADEDAEKIVTVGQLVDYIQRRLEAKKSGDQTNNGGISIQIKTKFVEISSGTEELAFDWIDKPCTNATKSAE